MLIRIVNVLDDIFRVEQDHDVMSQKADRVHAASRGAERRRHLLNYLRQHLEELRPYEPPTAVVRRAGRNQQRSRLREVFQPIT